MPAPAALLAVAVAGVGVVTKGRWTDRLRVR